MELWWNCAEFFFLPPEYNFQAMLDEFQIPAHVQAAALLRGGKIFRTRKRCGAWGYFKVHMASGTKVGSYTLSAHKVEPSSRSGGSSRVPRGSGVLAHRNVIRP